MKKVRKGTPGFIVGIIVYVLLSLISLYLAIASFIVAEDANQVDSSMLVMIGGASIIVFISLTLWFISFSVAYRQRKSQLVMMEVLLESNKN